MIYSKEVEQMCPVTKGAYHGPAPIPEEGKWVQAKEIKDMDLPVENYTYLTFCVMGAISGEDPKELQKMAKENVRGCKR